MIYDQLVDFHTLLPPSSPNWYLVVPEAIDNHAAQQKSPIYCVSAADLTKHVVNYMRHLPRTKMVYNNKDAKSFGYVQVTKFWRFPDYISIQIFPVSSNKSTLAVYSRAKYGYSDFGVNKKRVLQMLSHLEAKACNNV